MYLTLILFLCLLTHHALSQECQGAIKFVERSAQWYEQGMPQRIYDIYITNTHSSCTIRSFVSANIQLPPGSFMHFSWGFNGNNIAGFDTILPGQTHAGSGFIVEGYGDPSATISGYGGCDCPSEPTLTPQNPTIPPTSEPEPTSAPTAGPTPTPTEEPVDPSTLFSVGLKFLVLTCNTSDVRLQVAKSVLDAVGSQYDVVDQPTWGTAALSLKNPDGSGKYYAIVATIELPICWSTGQQTQLEAYELQFRAKMVILYGFPKAFSGVIATAGAALTATSYLTFAPAFHPSLSSVRADAQIPISGVYVYLTSITDPKIATPAVNLRYNDADYVAAALVSFPDTRTRLEFYIDHAAWALYPMLLGNAWFQWATNGVFAGARRIEFNVHVDDIFMATGMFDPEVGGEGKKDVFRMSPDDIDNVVEWQRKLNERLTTGSNFTLTFPHNGATIMERGGYHVDALFNKAKQYRDEFIWESHTWAHLYLDNLTYANVSLEYSRNFEPMRQLYDVEDLSSVPNYCTLSTITPSITGLFNGEALRAIYDQGFRFVVGDNTRAELMPANPYHTLHTTVETNGFAGIYVIPRVATYIYYDGSLPEHITTEYNWHYSSSLTFAQIVDKDVNAAITSLLAFRHDPFMFHQANLRFAFEGYTDGKVHSLVSYWVDEVITELTKYTTLPIKSHKHDYLGQMYLDREARDACGFSGTLQVSKTTRKIHGMTAQATGNCLFGVSGVQASGEKVVFFENYGPEKTTWFRILYFAIYSPSPLFSIYPSSLFSIYPSLRKFGKRGKIENYFSLLSFSLSFLCRIPPYLHK